MDPRGYNSTSVEKVPAETLWAYGIFSGIKGLFSLRVCVCVSYRQGLWHHPRLDSGVVHRLEHLEVWRLKEHHVGQELRRPQNLERLEQTNVSDQNEKLVCLTRTRLASSLELPDSSHGMKILSYNAYKHKMPVSKAHDAQMMEVHSAWTICTRKL